MAGVSTVFALRCFVAKGAPQDENRMGRVKLNLNGPSSKTDRTKNHGCVGHLELEAHAELHDSSVVRAVQDQKAAAGWI